MRALFVGGTVDNSEFDLDRTEPPASYPEHGGSGQSRYRLHEVGTRNGTAVYAVYAAPGLAAHDVERVVEERDYPRRFGVEGRVPAPAPGFARGDHHRR